MPHVLYLFVGVTIHRSYFERTALTGLISFLYCTFLGPRSLLSFTRNFIEEGLDGKTARQYEGDMCWRNLTDESIVTVMSAQAGSSVLYALVNMHKFVPQPPALYSLT